MPLCFKISKNSLYHFEVNDETVVVLSFCSISKKRFNTVFKFSFVASIRSLDGESSNSPISKRGKKALLP